MTVIQLQALADICALDEALDRIGCPRAAEHYRGIDRRAPDDEQRPSLAFRLGWLEGRIASVNGLIEAFPALERAATMARIVANEHRRGTIEPLSIAKLESALDDLAEVHATFALGQDS